MYKFIIDYYFEKYHTGELLYDKTRNAIVFADCMQDAITKIQKVDNEYKDVANLWFEEVRKNEK